MELIVGHTYEAKRPKKIGVVDPLMDDRMIVWIGLAEVQYDSPSVRFGRRLPKVSKEAFLRWAGRDVTNEMPRSEWRAVNAMRPNARIEPNRAR